MKYTIKVRWTHRTILAEKVTVDAEDEYEARDKAEDEILKDYPTAEDIEALEVAPPR